MREVRRRERECYWSRLATHPHHLTCAKARKPKRAIPIQLRDPLLCSHCGQTVHTQDTHTHVKRRASICTYRTTPYKRVTIICYVVTAVTSNMRAPHVHATMRFFNTRGTRGTWTCNNALFQHTRYTHRNPTRTTRPALADG